MGPRVPFAPPLLTLSLHIHFAYIFHFFSVIYLAICNMCNGQ